MKLLTNVWWLVSLHALGGLLLLFVGRRTSRCATASLLSVWLVLSLGTVIGHGGTAGEFTEKVKATLAYADDWQMPGMLVGRVVRSPRSACRIVSLDTRAAAAVPGVVAVVTAADVPLNRLNEDYSTQSQAVRKLNDWWTRSNA